MSLDQAEANQQNISQRLNVVSVDTHITEEKLFETKLQIWYVGVGMQQMHAMSCTMYMVIVQVLLV